MITLLKLDKNRDQIRLYKEEYKNKIIDIYVLNRSGSFHIKIISKIFIVNFIVKIVYKHKFRFSDLSYI